MKYMVHLPDGPPLAIIMLKEPAVPKHVDPSYLITGLHSILETCLDTKANKREYAFICFCIETM